MKWLRDLVAVAMATATLGLLTACDVADLPLVAGSSPDDTVLKFTMDHAADLVPAAEVMLNDVKVGSVKSIEFKDWKSEITIGISREVQLRSDVRVQVGQKSLLGAKYVRLEQPANSSAPVLQSGATLSAAQVASAPSTEQVLSAAGDFLGGSGLENVSSITREVRDALVGHEDDWIALLEQLNTLVAHIDGQRTNLVGLLEAADSLGARLAQNRGALSDALEMLPEVLEVVEDERKPIVEALTRLKQVSDDTVPVLEANGPAMVREIDDLARILYGTAARGEDVANAVGMLTFPVPLDSALLGVRGDYLNLFVDMDFRLSRLEKAFLSGTPLAGLLASLNGSLPPLTGLQSGDPLSAPLEVQPGTASQPDKQRTSPLPLPLPTPSTGVQVPESDTGILGDLVGNLLGGGSR